MMIFHSLSQIAPFSVGASKPSAAYMPSAQMSKIADAPVKGDGILAIKFAAPGERARKIISRSNARATGRFPSFRMGRMIHWDSPHELNAYRLLDSNPVVLAFAEQPCVIHYRLAGKDFRHYPDSLVKTAATNALWEVKTAADASRPEVIARTRLMTEHLPAYGYEYSIVFGEDLAREPRLRNVRFLLSSGRVSLSFEQKEYTRRLFAAVNFLRWQDVVEGRHAPFSVQQACRFVLDGVLHIKLDEKIGPETILCKIPGAALFGGQNG
jgi:hypothetical protein